MGLLSVYLRAQEQTRKEERCRKGKTRGNEVRRWSAGNIMDRVIGAGADLDTANTQKDTRRGYLNDQFVAT